MIITRPFLLALRLFPEYIYPKRYKPDLRQSRIRDPDFTATYPMYPGWWTEGMEDCRKGPVLSRDNGFGITTLSGLYRSGKPTSG